MRSSLGNLPKNIQTYLALGQKPIRSFNFKELMIAAKHPHFKSLDTVPVLETIQALASDLLTDDLEVLSFLTFGDGKSAEIAPNVRQVDGLPVLFIGYKDNLPQYVPLKKEDYSISIGESSLDCVLTFSGEEGTYFSADIPIAKIMADGESHDAVNVKFARELNWADRVKGLPSRNNDLTVSINDYDAPNPIAIVSIERKLINKKRASALAILTLENGDAVSTWNTVNCSSAFKLKQPKLFIHNGLVVGGKAGKVTLGNLGSDYNIVSASIRNVKGKENTSFDVVDLVAFIEDFGYTDLSTSIKGTEPLLVNLRAAIAQLDKITDSNPVKVRNFIVMLPIEMRPKTPDIQF